MGASPLQSTKFASFPEFVLSRTCPGPHGEIHDVAFQWRTERSSYVRGSSSSTIQPSWLHPPRRLQDSVSPPWSLGWAADPRSMLRRELSNTWTVPPGKRRLLSTARADNLLHSLFGFPVLPPRSWWWWWGGGGGQTRVEVKLLQLQKWRDAPPLTALRGAKTP